MKNNVGCLSVIEVFAYLLALPFFIVFLCLGLYQDMKTLSLLCCIGCVLSLLGIAHFNQQFKQLLFTLFCGVVLVCGGLLFKFEPCRSIALTILILSILSYSKIFIFVVKKMIKSFS